LIRTPIDFLKDCVRASVLLISRENISLPAILVNGVSVPRDCAIPGSEEERKGDINLNENKY